MKKISLLFILIMFTCAACEKPVENKEPEITKDSLVSQIDKLSYSIGISIGKKLNSDEMEINEKVLMKGLSDGLTGKDGLLTEQEAKDAIVAFQKQKAQERQMEAEKIKKEGEAFLEKKKTEEGVVALPSGLLYKIINEGDGNSPGPKDTVVVNYRGKLIDGTEFDSSYERGKPATFKVNRVIKGWTEALQLMKPGAKWELYIPSNLAYGPRGTRKIPANSALNFEIELVSFDPKAEKAPKAETAPKK